jgi:hypothetical protein
MRKNQMIILDISKEDYQRLVNITLTVDTTPKKLLEQFINDLVYNEKSGGSDECDLAESWVQRSKFNF